MSTVSQPDSELWLAVRNDNELAFNELFNRYWARLYKVACYKLSDKEVSAEIVHDIFLSIWQRRHQLDIEHFSGYLLMCVRYQVYTRLKAAKAPVVYKEQLEEYNYGFSWNKGDVHIQENELQQALHFYTNQLPRRCYEIFNLSRVEHLSNQEIAQRLGISKKSVENQLTMALKHLRTAFDKVPLLLLVITNLLLAR